MLPGGKTRVPFLIIIGLLTLNFCACGLFSYQGSGVSEVGYRARNTVIRSSTIRSGSLGGPSIIGGSSSSGSSSSGK